MQLLLDDCLFRVDGAHYGRKEESETGDSDVVQQELEVCGEADRGKETEEEALLAEFVNDFGLADAFELDAIDAELLLFFGQEASCFGAVDEGGHSEEAQDDGDDA